MGRHPDFGAARYLIEKSKTRELLQRSRNHGGDNELLNDEGGGGLSGSFPLVQSKESRDTPRLLAEDENALLA